MKMKHVLAAGIPFLGIVIAGCGGGGGGGGSSTPATTTISTQAQGTQASAAGSQSASLAANSATSLSGLASTVGAPKIRSAVAKKNPRLTKLNSAAEKAHGRLAQRFSAAKAAKAGAGSRAYPYTNGACTNGGSWNETFATPTADTFTYTATFTSCREGDVMMNGTYNANGGVSGSTFTINMSVGGTGANSVIDGTGDYVETYYTTTTGTTVAAHYYADMVVTGSYGYDTTTGAVTFSYSGTGAERFHVPAGAVSTGSAEETYNLTLSSLSLAGGLSQTAGASTPTDYTDDIYAWSETFNGGVTESWNVATTPTANTGEIAVTYTTLAYVERFDLTFNNVWWAVDGTVTSNFTPDVCFEGTFTVDTTTDVHEQWNATTSSYDTVAGVIVINGNTTLTFNSNGSVTVAVTGASSTTYTGGLDELEAQNCPIETMGTTA